MRSRSRATSACNACVWPSIWFPPDSWQASARGRQLPCSSRDIAFGESGFKRREPAGSKPVKGGEETKKSRLKQASNRLEECRHVNRREPGPRFPRGAGGLTNPKESKGARTATVGDSPSIGASARLQEGETVILIGCAQPPTSHCSALFFNILW